jgi:N-acetylglucosamine-6-sulfatase
MAPSNIVVILVDDADVKVLEHTASSRIRAALLDSGATATRYLTTHPLCAPSRASLLRGMYPQNTGVTGNDEAYTAFKSGGGEISNIARWLKAAPTPYRTGLVGKYMNKYEPAVNPRPNAGFDYWFGVGKDAYDSYDYDAWDDYAPAKVVHYGNDHDPDIGDYLTDVLKRKALQFLDDAATTEPFFLMVTPMAPHSPSVPSTLYDDLYLNEVYPQNANLSFNEADVSDKPWYVAMLPLLNQDRIAAINARFRRRLQCMESVADLVEAVIDKLDDTGVLEDTYVFFTSDHGFHMGEHRLGNDSSQDEADGTAPGGKNSMYEEDIKVPLWIRHPSITVSSVDQLLGNVDLAPTFCDIAGIDLNTPPDVLDGRSFLPLLTGQSVPWRSQYLISRGQTKPFVGLRHADEWVFEQLLTPVPDEVAGEYYVGLDDPVSGDPFELDNGYLDLDPDRLADLQDLAAAYSHCAGDCCRVYDSQNI